MRSLPAAYRTADSSPGLCSSLSPPRGIDPWRWLLCCGGWGPGPFFAISDRGSTAGLPPIFLVGFLPVALKMLFTGSITGSRLLRPMELPFARISTAILIALTSGKLWLCSGTSVPRRPLLACSRLSIQGSAAFSPLAHTMDQPGKLVLRVEFYRAAHSHPCLVQQSCCLGFIKLAFRVCTSQCTWMIE